MLPVRFSLLLLLPCIELTISRKVAWSRLGCIAYISQDGLRVNVRYLQCQPSDGKWVLSDDTPLHPVTEAHGGRPLVHLCWNEMGSELAVVDSSGRVSIYSILVALNSIAGLRQAAFDPDDDGSQIVGVMWLNLQRSVSRSFIEVNVPDWQYRFMHSIKRQRSIAVGLIRPSVAALLVPSIRPIKLHCSA